MASPGRRRLPTRAEALRSTPVASMSLAVQQLEGSDAASTLATPPLPAFVVEAQTDAGLSLGVEALVSVEDDAVAPVPDVPATTASPARPAASREYRSQHGSAHHHGYANCFGLPYQDHNYGAPPPPTPPQSPPRQSFRTPPSQTLHVNGTLPGSEGDGTGDRQSPPSGGSGGRDEDCGGSNVGGRGPPDAQEDSITRCICGFNHDDEYMICCDRCSVWQHVDCMGLDRSRIPDTYLCEQCHPRRVDRHRARVLQARKKDEMARSLPRPESTSDESGGGAAGGDENRGGHGQHKGSGDGRGQGGPRGRLKVRRRRRKSDSKAEVLRQLPLKRLGSSKGMKERIERKKAKLKKMVKVPKNRFLNLAQVPVKPERCKTGGGGGGAVEEEVARDAWSSPTRENGSQDRYEAALINQYSPEVQLMAGSLKLNGQHEELVRKVCETGAAVGPTGSQPWRVANGPDGSRRLVAARFLPARQPIIEFRGKFLLAQQFHEQNPVFNKRSYPFVLFYKPNKEEHVCVDAREYGNEARFVRRSCCPNAEVQHIIQNGLLHLFLVSLKDVRKDEEITVPFDFNYRECIHGVTCACGSDDCHVGPKGRKGAAVAERRRRGRRSSSSATVHSTADEDEEETARGPCRSLPSPTKLNHHHQQATIVNHHSHQDSSTGATSPSPELAPAQEGQPTEEQELDDRPASSQRRRKMTREERKIDAIMRAFEKMERTEKRRQQALERMAQHRGGGTAAPQQAPHLQQASPEVKVGTEVLVGQEKFEEEQSSEWAPAVPEEQKPEAEESASAEEPAAAEAAEVPVVRSEEAVPVAVTTAAQCHRPAKKGKRRRGSSVTSRRRTRTFSGGSDLPLSPEEAAVVPPETPSVEAPEQAPQQFVEDCGEGQHCGTPPPEPTAPATAASPTSSPCPAGKGFALPKSKRFLMQGWLQEKASEPCGPFTMAPDAPRFVRCTRDSSGGISAAHLRRNSLTQTAGGQQGSGGSAKKRWLRQAMFECGETSELSEDGHHDDGGGDLTADGLPSPGYPTNRSDDSNHSVSPTAVEDMVTPLKKRRLMRKSAESVDSLGGLSPTTGEAAATLLSFQAPQVAAVAMDGILVGSPLPPMHHLVDPMGDCSMDIVGAGDHVCGDDAESCGADEPVADDELDDALDTDPPTPLDDEVSSMDAIADCDDSTAEDGNVCDPAAVARWRTISETGGTDACAPADFVRWRTVPENAVVDVTVEDEGGAIESADATCRQQSATEEAAAAEPATPPTPPTASPTAITDSGETSGRNVTQSNGGSSVQKRKVSLSEYRMRMRDAKGGGSGGPVSPLGAPLSPRTGGCGSLPVLESLFGSDPIGSQPPSHGLPPSPRRDGAKREDDDPWVQPEPRRERLSQRLRREFGLDDDSDSERDRGKGCSPPPPPGTGGPVGLLPAPLPCVPLGGTPLPQFGYAPPSYHHPASRPYLVPTVQPTGGPAFVPPLPLTLPHRADHRGGGTMGGQPILPASHQRPPLHPLGPPGRTRIDYRPVPPPPPPSQRGYY